MFNKKNKIIILISIISFIFATIGITADNNDVTNPKKDILPSNINPNSDISICNNCNSVYKAGKSCPVCEMKKDKKEEAKYLPEVGITLMANYTYTLNGITNTTSNQYSTKSTGANRFNLERAYLNVKKNITDYIGGKLTLDIRSDKLLVDQGGLPMIVKNAYMYFSPLGYLNPKYKDFLWINFGIIPLPGSISEGIWNQRYIEKPFLDKYSFAPTADFGLGLNGSCPNNIIKYNIAVVNGIGYAGKGDLSATNGYDGKVEGETKDGANNYYKDFYGEISISPLANNNNKWLQGIGIYGGGIVRSDKTNKNDTNIIMAGVFLKHEKLLIGFDGFKFSSEKNKWTPSGNGFSGYIAFYPIKPLFFVSRLDYLDLSKEKDNEINPTKGVKDTNTEAIFGIGCELAKGARICLDFIIDRSWDKSTQEYKKTQYLGAHTELKF